MGSLRQRRIPGCTTVEPLRFIIGHIPHLPGHEPGKEIVDGVCHRLPGTEITGQVNQSRKLHPIPGDKLLLLFQEDGRRGVPEPVDALFQVSHQKEIFSILRDTAENQVLKPIGVLVLIQQNLLIPFRIFPGKGRGISLIIGYQPQGIIGKVCKVSSASFLLGLIQPLPKSAGECEKRLDYRQLSLHIRLVFRFGAAEQGHRPAHLLLGCLAEIGSPLLQLKVAAFGRRKPAKGVLYCGHRLVPAEP